MSSQLLAVSVLTALATRIRATGSAREDIARLEASASLYHEQDPRYVSLWALAWSIWSMWCVCPQGASHDLLSASQAGTAVSGGYGDHGSVSGSEGWVNPAGNLCHISLARVSAHVLSGRRMGIACLHFWERAGCPHKIRLYQQERRSKWSVLEMVLGFIIFPLVGKLLHFLVFYYIQNYVFFTFLEKTQYLSKRERETSYHWLNHIPNAHVGRDWS